MRSRIMAHMVACFPDREGSLEVARGLADGGASYLEVQLPFSDPMADGPDIQVACRRALEAGFTVDDGLRLLAEISRTVGVPVFVMSYANLLFTRGIERFLGECVAAGVAGTIVPDLPRDYDEGLFARAAARGLMPVPLLSPSMTEERLSEAISAGTELLYATLRTGTTGRFTDIGEENLGFIGRIRACMPPDRRMKVVAGFGVSTREQVRALEGHVHAVVVGSALVRAVEAAQARGARPGDAVQEKMIELSAAPGPSPSRP
jgi:tryptophan synthase alpha chain